MHVLVVDEDDSLRDMLARLVREIAGESVAFAFLEQVPRLGSVRRTRWPDELVVLDVSEAHTEDARRRVEKAFPRATVVTIANGEYEAVLGNVMKRRRRSTSRARRRRAETQGAVIR
jgi:hypothetical protein